MDNKIRGQIVKATGGFYYVQTDQELFQCRARGLFRKEGVMPYVGDFVIVEPTEDGNGCVTVIENRKNLLIRPPVANLDQLVLVTSIADPTPNVLILDKLSAIALHKNIRPVLVITKCDLADPAWLRDIYSRTELSCLCVSVRTGEGMDELERLLEGKLSAFSGNSGVGKSSLLNAIDPQLGLPTGITSQKLGRGKHTTRHVELFPLKNGGVVADTPGFSSVETERFEVILKDQLQYCFAEFEEHIGGCKFTGCSHTVEKGCAVLKALEDGFIHPSRHKSYRAMYEDAKNIKEWEL